MSLQRVPIEVMHFIIEDLGLDDLFNLSLACSQFQYLIRNHAICKAVLLSDARHSLEAARSLGSGDFGAGLRTIVKRRKAISGALPYQAAIVGVADRYVYSNGVLCYTLENLQLRVLDIHNSLRREIVIDTRMLLSEAVPGSRSVEKYEFYPVHCAHGILSCIYTSKRRRRTTRVLLIIDLERTEVVNALYVDSVHRLFVRNDARYLYFGTHSVTGEDGYLRWVLRQFDLRTRTWFSSGIVLSDVVGSEIGKELCFEIFDGHFYGVSNEADFELQEIGTESHYHAFRFPLGPPDAKGITTATHSTLPRRYHSDGIIDNRWNVLQLEKDETTGQIMILESRMEILARESKSLRSCYKRLLHFSEHIPEDTGARKSEVEVEIGADVRRKTPEGGLSPHGEMPLSRPAVPEYQKPQNVHHGDDGSKLPIYTFSQCFIRSYVSSCHSFVDVVNDPLPWNPLQQRLRLRVRPQSDGVSNSCSELKPPQPANFGQESLAAARHGSDGCLFWPPERNSQQLDPLVDAKFQELEYILNPPFHDGKVEWAADSRSVIYSRENAEGMKALVFIGFDPSIRVHGLRRFGGGKDELGVEGSVVPSAWVGDVSSRSSGKLASVASQFVPQGPALLAGATAPTSASTSLSAPWARLDDPLYLAISRDGHGPGFDFCQ